MRHGQRECGGHRGVDRVASLGEHRGSRVRRNRRCRDDQPCLRGRAHVGLRRGADGKRRGEDEQKSGHGRDCNLPVSQLVYSVTMTPMLRTVSLALLALSVMLMAIGAPGATWRELQFMTTIALVTLVTRSMSTRYGISALSLGMGLTTLFVIGAGHAMTAAGIDTTAGIGNWFIVPLVEEAVKLAPVGIVVWLYARRRRFAPNPSDLLMLGCFAGAGFALVENSQLFQQGGGIARDMARQY